MNETIKQRKEKSEFRKYINMNENVAMVYLHPGIKPKLISKLSSYDGVVLIGTGLGHAPINEFKDKRTNSIFSELKNLIESDIPVAMSSQAIYGRLSLRVYQTGRRLKEIGVMGDGADWTPETAYVKMCWVLGQTKDIGKVREMMTTNIAGEINTRSPIEKQGI